MPNEFGIIGYRWIFYLDLMQYLLSVAQPPLGVASEQGLFLKERR